MEVTGHPWYTSQKVSSSLSLVENTQHIENLSLLDITYLLHGAESFLRG
jgi:hypothetical protein